MLARPNKIHLPADQYFTTQSVYLGCAVPTGTVLIAAIIVTLVYTIAMRAHAIAFSLSLTAFILTAATLAIFFIWTFPANQATTNWTVIPENWQALRKKWEFGHMLNAVLTFIALCAVTASTLTDRRSRRQLD